MSEIARRMTDLFTDPEPIEVVSERGPVFLERDLIHRTSRNELVRSKAELAIAEKLHAMGVSYVYEQPLKLGDRTRYPDFTIENDDSGVTYYWEHLGLLVDPDYARRWEIKRQAYLDAGVCPIEEARDADRILITTREVQGSICRRSNAWPPSFLAAEHFLMACKRSCVAWQRAGNRG
jgi:hypothetical protein